MPEPLAPVKKKFFISYNKADRAWAEWIAWHLEETGGYSVAIQAWDFGPGCNFVLEMDRALRECERVLAVLSPDYLTSLYTQPEWAGYFAQDPAGEQRLILPVRVRACELKGLLAQIVYLDLVGVQEESAARMLLEKSKRGRGKPAAAPGFPGRPPRVTAGARPFPGALPEVWNVPHPRNPNFTEPGTTLADLRSALLSGKTAALTQAVTGLGGVGKTQLATEYAWRHASDYALVWWIRAEEPSTLAADYAALAAELGLPEKDATEQPAAIAAVRTALRHRADWLLIFDNAEAGADLVPFLPGSPGHILITSRNPDWGGIAARLPVQQWPAELSVEFLLRRTGQTDAAAAGEIAREFGGLPLALEQAAAYVGSASTTLARYLELYRQRRSELHKRGRAAPGYDFTVATTWQLAFERMEKATPAAVALLRLCAFLAPDEIPRDVMIAGATALPEPLAATVGDALAFNDAVAALRRYSFVEVAGDTALSVHRVVRAVVRDGLDSADRSLWAAAAVKIVSAAFPFDSDDVTTWKDCERLLPHALAATEHAEASGTGLDRVARLANQMGLYFRGRAEFAKARAAYERALRIGETVLGPQHPNVATYVNNLGVVLRALGDLPGAKAAYERALQINEAAFGPHDPNVATGVNNLGGVLRDLGDLPGAKAAYERALQIDEAAFGPLHPEVATDVNNLGGVLRDLGDLPGAKAAFERALQINEAAFGPLHPEVATDVNNLGTVLQDLGDLPGAKAAFERALRINEAAYGSLHPKVATCVSNLGGVLEALGDLRGAKAAFERALEIFVRVYGEQHQSTRIVRENLALLTSPPEA